MTIAYLVNLYPKVSHSFIRREIVALENTGLSVARFSIRSGELEIVDPADKLELEKTRVVLGVGILRLFFNLVAMAIAMPIPWLKALSLTWKVGWRSDRGIWRHFAYLAEACVLVRWLSKIKVTQIHAHFGAEATTVAMLCSVLGRIPYSFTVHGPVEFDKAEGFAVGEKIKRAAFVVAISYFCQSQLYRLCDCEQWQKIHVIRCGLDDSYLSKPLVKILDLPNLVCVARLSEDKGHLLLIKAANQLAREGLNFKIVLVGDGHLRPKLEALIKLYHLEERVKITGWATGSEVQQYIINSRTLVLPSFAEGLPVVVMEALALGRPVISTYVAGIPELVKDQTHGWLVPAGSVEALTEAIRKAIQCPIDRLELMGKVGKERVTQLHNVTAEASKLAALFKSINVSC
ncbi:glycosyltransferase family 4 protein [Microseira sp. BLCC-F43]|jgi:glycosyltransferase involved in cell wall biosynthesis|uniref:glycosyltransferase family 4 protein n=1 Tax=Microseira sp. BLCC-F43 TaxID=3153602 RepID=UPI0035B899B9